MSEEKKLIDVFLLAGIYSESIENLNNILIDREVLLDEAVYKKILTYIPYLKKIFSSSYMNSLHSNANKKQKWPLINLIRQLLKAINYKLTPIRKACGYTKEKKKIFKRYFRIDKVKKKNTSEKNKENNDKSSTSSRSISPAPINSPQNSDISCNIEPSFIDASFNQSHNTNIAPQLFIQEENKKLDLYEVNQIIQNADNESQLDSCSISDDSEDEYIE